MVWYVIKLLVLLPLIGLLIWGSLKLTRRLQANLGAGDAARERSVRVVEAVMLSPGQRLAVIEFHGREILVACSRQGFTRLAEVDLRPAPRAAQPWEMEQ
jgi:flagellar protein FliO/FliZ